MKIKEETDGLIVLADDPKEYNTSLILSVIITLIFIVLMMKSEGNVFFNLMVLIGIYGIFINLYYLFREESIIMDKKGSNLVVNKFGRSQKIPFSNIRNIKIERQIDTESPDLYSVNMRVKCEIGSINIYNTSDESEAERFAEKISKLTNSKITCEKVN